MTLKNKTHVYFMPGMCANSLIFERIKLNKNFIPHYLSWIPPLKNESLSKYVVRLSETIKHKDAILIGVSFGGVIVQELSKILKIKKVIIISSVKSNKELSNSMKFAKKTKSYKLLPLTWLNDFESLLAFVLGPKIKRKVRITFFKINQRRQNDFKRSPIPIYFFFSHKSYNPSRRNDTRFNDLERTTISAECYCTNTNHCIRILRWK